MSAIMGQSRRPRLYFFVAAFFLAVFLFSLVGFHDVGLGSVPKRVLLSGDWFLLGFAYINPRKRETPLSQHGMDT